MAKLKFISSILAALLTLELASTAPQTEYSGRSKFNCPDTFSTTTGVCSCSYALSDYEIQCPIMTPRIIVRVQPGSYVSIECSDPNEDYFNLVPEMKLGNTSTVQIRRCPLPRRQSLKSIFEKLGATRVNKVLFQSYGVDIGNSLLRQHFQGLDDIQRLVLSSNGISEIPSDLFDDMTNLHWLDLRSNRVHLPPNIFNKLENLSVLELGFNNIEHIEDGLFKNQRKLQHLNLWGNKLHNLRKQSFEGVSSVTDLDLSANQIVTLQPDVFTLLTSLATLSLNANNFTELPHGLFANNKKLKLVKIMENKVPLETLPNELFANLPEILDIRIRCQLKSIPEDVFKGSSKLQNISLARNRISTLHPKLFEDQNQLLDLDLSRNELYQLSDDLFVNTHELQVLRLSYNHLYNISASIFQNLKSLRELYMNNNNLHFINENVFQVSQLLQVIRLENNYLSFNDFSIDFPMEDGYGGSPFQYLNELRVLNLRNNSITNVVRDWTTIAMEELDLSYNHISIISYTDLQFLAAEITVNLSHNNIFEINMKDLEPIASLPNQTERSQAIKVYLNDNPLKCNCVIYDFVKYLHGTLKPIVYKKFDLIPGDLRCDGPENLAGELVKDLNSCDLVCPLDYAGSKIKKCPKDCSCTVRACDRGLVVDCSNLGLSMIPELPSPTELGLSFIELHMENNNLTRLPSASMAGYSEVTALYVQNNSIATLSIDNLPEKLFSIDLSNNKMTHLNKSVISYMNMSKTLNQTSLGQNPWECTCESFDLIDLIQIKHQNFKDYHEIRCADGKPFKTRTKGILCSKDDNWITIICITTACLGLLIGLLAALYYKYQTEIKVWLFAKNLLLWLITEEELDKDKIYDAFISYSHKDEEFITEHLVPTLEKEPMSFKTCVHIRDWMPGEMIPVQIAKSVEDSRRTIVVLSKNFLDSVWGRMEFRTAHTTSLTEGRARVIVIIYGDIGNVEELDPELQAYLKTNTYVKWGDQWFWDKLRFAMPHPPTVKGLRKGLVKNSLKSSVDDKLELIKPIPVTPPALTTPPAEMNGGLRPPFSISREVNQNEKYMNGYSNGHVNGAFLINTNAKQSDV